MTTYILGSKPNASVHLIKNGDTVVFVNGSLHLLNGLNKSILVHHVLSDYILFSEEKLPLKVRSLIAEVKVDKLIVSISKTHQDKTYKIEEQLKKIGYRFDEITLLYPREKKDRIIGYINNQKLISFLTSMKTTDLIKEIISIYFFGNLRKIKPSTGFLAALIYEESEATKCLGIGLNNSNYFFDPSNNHERGHIEFDTYLYEMGNMELIDL